MSVWQGKGDFMSGEEKGGYFLFPRVLCRNQDDWLDYLCVKGRAYVFDIVLSCLSIVAFILIPGGLRRYCITSITIGQIVCNHVLVRCASDLA